MKSPLPRFRDRGTAAEFYGALAAAEIPFAVNAKKLPVWDAPPDSGGAERHGTMKKTRLPMTRQRKKEALSAYLFIAPMFLGLLVFSVGPFFENIFFSFRKMGTFGNGTFIGLRNYQKLLQDETFWLALRNTFSTPLWAYLLSSYSPFSLQISSIRTFGAGRCTVPSSIFPLSPCLPLSASCGAGS